MTDQHGERNLKAALRELAADLERGLDSHPAREELVDFAAGDLPASERDRLGEHLALCRDCSRIASELSAAEPELGRLTAKELDAEWERFQKAAGISPRRPQLQVLAAALLVGLLGLVAWVFQREMGKPRADVAIVALAPAEVSRGAAPPPVRLPDWAGRVSLILEIPYSAPEHPEYQAEIRTKGGDPVWSGRCFLQEEGIVVDVPRRRLPRGAYQIRLLGPQEKEVAVYDLLIES